MGDTSALFKQYEADYCNRSTDISRKIGTIPSLSEIKSMEMEARSLPPPSAQPLLAKVKDYKLDLSKLREQMKAASVASPMGDAARAELGLGGDYYSTSAGQRERMLTATQKLESSNKKLEEARQTLASTEDIGAGILKDLHGQRETILRSRETLQGADDNIGKARKILSGMARRVMQNKIIMFGIIAFLLAAIGIILYVKLKPSS